MVGVITWDDWSYINAEGTECQVFCLQLQAVKRIDPFPWGYPPFFFFFPQVATYGLRETFQVTPSPFWPSNASLLERLLFDGFLITQAADDFSLGQIS